MYSTNRALLIFGLLSPLLVAGRTAGVTISPLTTLFQTQNLIINSTFVATYDSDHAVISINAAESIGVGDSVPKLLTYKFNLRTQTIEREIGTGQRGFSGDGGPADQATYSQVGGLAVDKLGNIFFSDLSNNRIRKVTPSWQIDTVAGTGQLGFAGDGGTAAQAQFQFPTYLATDQANNLYVYDSGSKRIRELFVDPSRGEVTRQSRVQTIIGGASGAIREGVLGTETSIHLADAVTVDDRGNIYYLDENRARRYDFLSKKVLTVMGNGTATFNGDGVPATDKYLNLSQLSGIEWIAAGFLVISDTVNRRLRLLDLAANKTSTLAGNGNIGISPDGTPPLECSFTSLTKMAVVTKPDGTKQLLVFERDRLMRADILGLLSSPTPGGTVQIGGTVTYYMDNTPSVQNVVVQLIAKNNPSQIRSTMTDAHGAFNFPNLPAQQSWQVYFLKKGNSNGAITALDATRVLQTVAGMFPNPQLGPQQIKACDVTGDGKLSALDAAKILRVVAGIDSSLPITGGQPSDWVFFAQPTLSEISGASYIAPNYPAHTFGGADLPTVGVSTSRLNFSAAVIGDCTGNWSP